MDKNSVTWEDLWVARGGRSARPPIYPASVGLHRPRMGACLGYGEVAERVGDGSSTSALAFVSIRSGQH